MSSIAGPRTVLADRRNRHHLRELCDEVLASFRIAHERDLFDDEERSEARKMLSRILPKAARRL